MSATEDLRNEHEGIQIALNVLERLANELRAGETVDQHDLAEILRFLKTFADTCHHGKEEEVLFPALRAVGVPLEGGPIGVMLAEHTMGRADIRAMDDALSRLQAGDREAGPAFATSALHYVRLLREHIAKENNILFVMADQRLSPDQQARITEAFDRIERERIGVGVHEEFHALLDRLQAKYLEPPASAT